MSRYIHLLNAVKSSIGQLALTTGQAACRRRIRERLEYPGVVNVYGSSGVGKTALGWAMAANNEVIYVPDGLRWQQLVGSSRCPLYLDNAPSDRATFRRMLSRLETKRVDRIVVVTRMPVDDYVFRAELALTADDTATVRHNLEQLHYPSADGQYSNLWDVLLHIVGEVQ